MQRSRSSTVSESPSQRIQEQLAMAGGRMNTREYQSIDTNRLTTTYTIHTIHTSHTWQTIIDIIAAVFNHTANKSTTQPVKRRKTCNNLSARSYPSTETSPRALLLTPPPHASSLSPLAPAVQARSSDAVFLAYSDAQSLLELGAGYLPAELLIHIFKHLSHKDINMAGQSCRWWQMVSEQNSLWMLKFSERFQRPQTIIDKFTTTKYILKLEELKSIHLVFGNKVEAGICLLHHAQLISWDNEAKIKSQYGYPSESQSDRKERLLNAALHLFIEGKYWERALTIVKKLRKKYKKDLLRTSDKTSLVKRMVALSERFFEEYFFVEFRGKGFPKSVDGRKFIFRGRELEKLGTFVARLKSRYPVAQVVPKTDKDDYVTGQYIHIRPCRPVALPNEFGHLAAPSNDLPRTLFRDVRAYINNTSRTFFFSIPFKKRVASDAPTPPQAPGGSNEFLDLWTCHTYIVAAATFPGLIRVAEVTSVIEMERNPLENAIETLDKKNRQLETIFDSTRAAKEWSNNLTMALNGVVDAAVSGGVNMYRVFFSMAYAQDNPGHLKLLCRLKSILMTQRHLLESGLDIHAHYCPANIKALQNKMEVCFERWKLIIDELVVQTPVPDSAAARPPSPIKMIDEIDLPPSPTPPRSKDSPTRAKDSPTRIKDSPIRKDGASTLAAKKESPVIAKVKPSPLRKALLAASTQPSPKKPAASSTPSKIPTSARPPLMRPAVAAAPTSATTTGMVKKLVEAAPWVSSSKPPIGSTSKMVAPLGHSRPPIAAPKQQPVVSSAPSNPTTKPTGKSAITSTVTTTTTTTTTTTISTIIAPPENQSNTSSLYRPTASLLAKKTSTPVTSDTARSSPIVKPLSLGGTGAGRSSPVIKPLSASSSVSTQSPRMSPRMVPPIIKSLAASSPSTQSPRTQSPIVKPLSASSSVSTQSPRMSPRMGIQSPRGAAPKITPSPMSPRSRTPPPPSIKAPPSFTLTTIKKRAPTSEQPVSVSKPAPSPITRPLSSSKPPLLFHGNNETPIHRKLVKRNALTPLPIPLSLSLSTAANSSPTSPITSSPSLTTI
eukprot:gene14184-16724_t